MNVNEMRNKLIERFKGKQMKTLNDYIKKINSENSTKLLEEYELVILGKTPRKKKPYYRKNEE